MKFVKPGEKPRVRVWAEPKAEQTRIWVEDCGIGIEGSSFDKIFSLFGRGEHAAGYEGTGIGLAIVRKAVERMGGRVGLESKVGEGSRFWVELAGWNDE